jgi:hypothetical protein
MRIESRWALPQKPKLESLNLGKKRNNYAEVTHR